MNPPILTTPVPMGMPNKRTKEKAFETLQQGQVACFFIFAWGLILTRWRTQRWFIGAKQAFVRRGVMGLILASVILGNSPLFAQKTADPTSSSTRGEADTGPLSEGVGGSSGELNVSDSVAVDDVPADEPIANRLKSVLRATEWFDDLAVRVTNGVVFITGTTKDSTSKQWASRLATNTDGVTAVVNRITVEKVDTTAAIDTVTSSVRSLWEDLLSRSPLIAAGIIVLLLTSLAVRLFCSIVSRITRKSRLRTSLQDLVLQLLTIAIWTIGLLLAAVIVFPGLTPAKALTVLGLGSVAIGFAFKDIFENFFAGILILWKYPFDKGDFVECGSVVGRIEDITVRMTMIRQVDGQLAVVPNAMLFKSPVDVLTSRKSRRTTVVCGVSYDANLDEARSVLDQAVQACQTVRKDEPIEIFAQDLADSSINFEVTWWTGSTPLEIRRSRDEVLRTVRAALSDAAIEIPFPQRTVWLPGKTD